MKKIKIGIIAPANSIVGKSNTEIFKKGVELLEQNNFEVIVGKNVFSTSEVFCGTIEEKIDDIYYVCSKCKYVICATGGINSNTILDKLDFEKIKYNVFIGNSNPTLLFNSFYKINNQYSYIGPNVKSIGKKVNDFMIKSLKRVIYNTSKKIFAEKNNLIIKKGTASGIAIGGNISSLRRIIGTRFFPSDFKNYILCLEADPKETSHLEFQSIISQFKQANIFNNCKALIVGYYDDYEFVASVFNDFDIPIIVCENIGHGVNNTMFPIGKLLEIDESGNIYEKE